MTLAWRTSSYSSDSANCVEVAWRTSSFCSSGGCVEVGPAGGAVHVRDSKDRGGPVLTFAPDAWRAFVATLKGGD